MRKKIRKTLLALCLVLGILASVLPASAATTYQVFAKSVDGELGYHSIETAWDAVLKGIPIVLMRDWNLTDRLVVSEGKEATVYMNGYTIKRDLTMRESDGEVIYLEKNAKLTLKGCGADGKNIVGKSFSLSTLHESGTLVSGGLVTGGLSTNGAGGIHMKKGSSLILDNVIVGGNSASEDCGGGVNMNNEGTSLTLMNGASIAYNYAEENGGGVYVADENCTITLTGGSRIEHNYCVRSGGGIYIEDEPTTIDLEGSSSISDNYALEFGGGIFVYYTPLTLLSKDKTGIMSGNYSKKGGGAVYIDSSKFSENLATISGITFTNNVTAKDGGALYLGQESTSISDCTFTNNRAEGKLSVGGGIANYNDENSIRDCVIRGNYATVSGGGVFSNYSNDIQLYGKVIIKNNTRSGDSPDDLYLLYDYWTTTSYIISNPGEGSEIGLRTNATSTRKVGKKAKFNEKVFFSDVSGFYMHADDEEQELYLVAQNNAAYPVTVNGKLQGYYNDTAVFTVDDWPAPEDKKFDYWYGDLEALAEPAQHVTLASTKGRKAVSVYSSYSSKFEITQVETITLEVNSDADEAALRELLPTTAQALDSSSNVYTVNVDRRSTEVEFGSVLKDGMVVSEGTILVPLKLESTGTVANSEGNMLEIKVKITESPEPEQPDLTPEVTAPTAKTGLYYTGSDQKLLNPGTAIGGTLVYSLSKNGTYTAEIPTGNAAGDYTVWYKVLGDTGYADTEPQSISVTIAEKKAIFIPVISGSTVTLYDSGYDTCLQDTDCPIAQFRDADPKAWYHDGVHDCLAKGLMQGVSTTEFAPDGVMTRAQLVTILWRLNGEKSVNYGLTFEDVSFDSWYTEAIRWAACEGIVNGYSDKAFGPNDAVTREQLAAILWRCAKYMGMDVSAGSQSDLQGYTDAKETSSYAVSAMQWAVAEGILNGTGKQTLSPTATATRAQTAAMIQRFHG